MEQYAFSDRKVCFPYGNCDFPIEKHGNLCQSMLFSRVTIGNLLGNQIMPFPKNDLGRVLPCPKLIFL